MSSSFITRIEREKHEPYTVIFTTDDHDKYRHIEDECHKMIGHAKPTVDAAPVRHGHWVMFDHAMSMWNVWACSECGYRRKEGWMHTEAGKKPNAQYCENCMAKMDGSVNDGT